MASHERPDHLRSALEAAELGSWQLDLPAYTLTCSERCKAIHGVAPHDELSFEQLTGLIQAEDAGLWRRALNAAANGDSNLDVEYRVNCSRDEVRWILARGRRYFHADGTPDCVIGVSRDITEYKHRQLLQSRNEQLLERIARDEPLEDCLAALCEAKEGLSPGIKVSIMLANDEISAFKRPVAPHFDASWGDGLEGAPINDLMISTCGEAVYRGESVCCEDVARDTRWSQEWRKLCLANGVKAGYSEPIRDTAGNAVGSFMLCFDRPRRPDTWDRAMIAMGSHIASIAVQRDLSRRALRDSEERFRVLADSVDQLVWIADGDGMISWYNRRWQEFTGTGLGRTLGKAAQFIHPDFRDHVLEKLGQHFASGEMWEDVFPLRGTDGEYRWFLSRAIPRRNRSGKVTHWFGTHTDITEQKSAEQALKETDRQKDEFLATLSHELRNPLAPMRNALEILQRRPGERRESDDDLVRVMDRQLNHMVRLVDDLLEFSRLTRGRIELRRERQSVAGIMQSAVEISKPGIDLRQHRLNIEVPEEGVMVNVDAMRISQVLANLLNNAAAYTEPGGEISLTCNISDGAANLSVKDNGAGIDQETLPLIFDPFSRPARVKPHGNAQGLGIGLALAKQLVELHGGRIDAVSPGLGLGSEFIVALPLAAPLAAAAPDVAPEEEALPAGTSVLVVDDNRDAADSLTMLLQLDGAEVRACYGGQEALDVLQQQTPTAVLVDIGMPGMTGYEVARRIRAKSALDDVTLIALTGWGQEKDRRKAKAAGFDHHTTKPPELAVLKPLLVSRKASAA